MGHKTRSKLIGFKLGTKHIPKINRFYVENGYLVHVMAHQQINFSRLNKFCQLSKTLLPPPALRGHNHAGWNSKQN